MVTKLLFRSQNWCYEMRLRSGSTFHVHFACSRSTISMGLIRILKWNSFFYLKWNTLFSTTLSRSATLITLQNTICHSRIVREIVIRASPAGTQEVEVEVDCTIYYMNISHPRIIIRPSFEPSCPRPSAFSLAASKASLLFLPFLPFYPSSRRESPHKSP